MYDAETVHSKMAALSQQFQSYLENIPDIPVTEQLTAPTVDLFTLLTELTALKNEVKTESTQYKASLDTLKNALIILKNNQTKLQAELAKRDQLLQAHDQNLREQRQQLLKPVLLAWLEMRDQTVTSIANIEALMPRGFFAFLQQGKKQQFESLCDKHRTNVHYIDEQLANYGSTQQ